MEIEVNNTQHNIASYNISKQIRRLKKNHTKSSIKNRKAKTNKHGCKTGKQKNKKLIKVMNRQYCKDAFNINNDDLLDNIIQTKHECLICHQHYSFDKLTGMKKIGCVPCRKYIFDKKLENHGTYYSDVSEISYVNPNNICSYCLIYHDICTIKYMSEFCQCTVCNKYTYGIKCNRCYYSFCKKHCPNGKCLHHCLKYEKQEKHTRLGMKLLKKIKTKMGNNEHKYNKLMKRQRKDVFRSIFNHLCDIFGGFEDLVDLILDYMCKHEDFVRDITYFVACCNYRCGRKFITTPEYNLCYCGDPDCLNSVRVSDEKYLMKDNKATNMCVIKTDDELYCLENGIHKEANYLQLNDKYVAEILTLTSDINSIGVCKIGNKYYRVFCENCANAFMYKFAVKCAKYECKNRDVTKYCRIHYKLEHMRIDIEWDDRHLILQNYNGNYSDFGWKGGFYWDNKSINYNQHLIINTKRSSVDYEKRINNRKHLKRSDKINQKSYSKKRFDKKMNIKSRKRSNQLYLCSLKYFM